MCGCICEYEQGKQKKNGGIYIYFKEVNAINKGQ